ncbi:MAG: hypothetical protein HFH42_04150 [Lachnospiraceae bacterium]|jgi:hypothetical protein|nr:hypothetical protein [Lachnospiraceae bacterium]
MEKLYIALVDTPGLFASIIRRVIGIDYIHVVLSMDGELEEAYSVGRRNPAVPLLAGFEKEDAMKIERVFPNARYKIVSMECTSEQKENISRQLKECFAQRFRYHYCILGLPMLLCNIPFYQKNHYTCSSFVANILEENGIGLFEKHFSLVTPRDFYELENTSLEFEGTLHEFNKCCLRYPEKDLGIFRQAMQKLSYVMNGAV